MESKRQNLLKEIREINHLIKNNKAESASLLSKIDDVNLKIRVRRNLIQITNQQANLLTREINSNKKNIENLETELDLLKKNYADMVVRSYKSKSKQSKLMFLLSSENFLQAYKRYNYMKQYKSFQKKQADSIVSKTEQLHALNATLQIQKQNKEALIAENRTAQVALQKEKNQQQLLVKDLKKDEAKYRKSIAKKQKESDRIEAQIEKMIRDAIAKANKKSGTKKSIKTFTLTAEAKALAKNFSNNKGKLPWPTKRGVLTKKPGKQRHSAVKGVYTTSKGIEITTSKDSDARAVFNGEVFVIQKVKGANKAVYIRHGNYITVYHNLKEIYVKKGDIVQTKDPVGKIATNSENKTILKFYLFKDSANQNPTHWIYKM
ncbi:murein hydrolase activator EnvC family protein [Pseudofulvibacter geojedonensis]|uniref:Murein hydrolase activator EnvC family protein n=1 Tax=Pseudofulvibacter geojedonensis TaxID=1123758 RepID=A0ABW3I478_9FLAO